MPVLERPAAVPARQVTREHAHLISPGLASGLETIPFHDDGPLIRRLMAGADVHRDARTHVAVHRLEGVHEAERRYCEPHEHVVPELNLILPITALRYDIVLGEERYEVEGPASVFIPPGLRHSANVREGTGFFIAIILGVEDYSAAFAPEG